jgi:2,4-dienoyl-CoA reductase (NADPH2)
MLLLKNQFIFAPIKTGYSDGSGAITERHLAFYGRRSAYLGAVTPEPLYLDKGARELPAQIGIDNDDKIDGLRKLTGLLHNSDTKAIAHLNHPGRMANPKIPNNHFVSSTDKPCENRGAVPRRMIKEDIDQAIELFRRSAIRAEQAGFDIIELQFGHGYLLAQFLSPEVNDRQDEYGGSFENRCRFPLMVFDTVRQAVELPIIVRVSGEEMTPSGIKIDETIQLAKMLAARGMDAIHVSAGTVCSTPPWFFQHMFVPKGKTWEMAKQIKDRVDIPVIAVGQINEFEDIEKIRNEKISDYIAIGRALVADPDFVGKYLGKVKGDIRPCPACAEGCLGEVRAGHGLHCVVNPLVGNDYDEIEPAAEKKQYAVVGGGLAGMQAALNLKQRGHDVVLFEKDKLGGQFNLAYLPPQKQNLKKVVDYFVHQIKQESVDVIDKEVQEDDLLSAGYDGVILATGAVPAIPPVKGLGKFYWTEFLQDENLPENETVLIIGGGLIGIEMASKLVYKNNKVIIVEMLEEMARGMEMIEKTLTMKKLKAKNTTMYSNYAVTEVRRDEVLISGEKQIILKGINKIVIATGMQSYNPLEEKLKDRIPVYVIGDAREVGKAKDAIESGYKLASRL